MRCRQGVNFHRQRAYMVQQAGIKAYTVVKYHVAHYFPLFIFVIFFGKLLCFVISIFAKAYNQFFFQRFKGIAPVVLCAACFGNFIYPFFGKIRYNSF